MGAYQMMNNSNYPRDPDALYDDQIVAVLELKLRRDGAMSIAGSIDDEAFALKMLDAAKDSVRNYHQRNRSRLIVPNYDMPPLDTAGRPAWLNGKT